ncbi:putative peptidylprolyl isomerase [Helianthus annuus]|nr:putative peptidylprolyl isomerase [Helianthus annuus]
MAVFNARANLVISALSWVKVRFSLITLIVLCRAVAAHSNNQFAVSSSTAERVLEECWIDWFPNTRKMSNKNPLVYFDVSIDGDPVERMVFELFSDTVPKTAENFRALCTGEKGNSQKTGRPLHYKGSFFHRIIKGSLAQGGDFYKRDGSYGESIYGGKFPDESSKLKHDAPGLLTMAMADRDSRGSLFNITFAANRHLDRKYVVFGKLVQGVDVLKKIENVGDEDGRPTVTVKIIYCGEVSECENQSSDKKAAGKKTKDVSSEVHSHEVRRKGKHKKSSKDRRKKRRRYSSSESDSSSDMDSESSDSDSESDSDSSTSSSSDFSSSSDDRRKRKKRPSKRDRHKRGKRRDKRHAKRRRKHDKKSKRKSKRGSDSVSESASENEHGSEDNGDARKLNQKHNNSTNITDGNQSPSAEVEDGSSRRKTGDAYERVEGEYPKENGNRPSNGADVVKIVAGRPDVVNDHPRNSRSVSKSPQKPLSKSMSISPRRSPSVSPRRKNRSPYRSESGSKSPVRSISRSPVRGKKVSPSPSPVRPHIRKPVNRSPTPSPSPPRGRKSSRKSVSKSPVRSSRISHSRSPVRSSKRSLSRSSGRPPLRRSPSRSRSPVRPPARSSRRSYSRSPVGGRRGRSPSRSVSPDGRIRRGRGFSNRYSYARRYHSPDRSPLRSYRYGRTDHDRYSSYRRRSPLRDRSPLRYRARRSRTRSPSVSRSPVRQRRRYSRSRSPVETSRYRPSPPVERRRAPRSRTPPSRSRSPYEPRSSPSPSPRRTSRSKSKSKSISRSRSRSSSGTPPAKKGLVSYGDGSPDSGQK